MSAGGSLLAAKQAAGIVGREEGANSSSQVLALGCILEIVLVPLGERENRRGLQRTGKVACRLSLP